MLGTREGWEPKNKKIKREREKEASHHVNEEKRQLKHDCISEVAFGI